MVPDVSGFPAICHANHPSLGVNSRDREHIAYHGRSAIGRFHPSGARATIAEKFNNFGGTPKLRVSPPFLSSP